MCLYLRKRIDGEFRYGQELIGGDETSATAIELTKPLIQRNYLLLRNFKSNQIKSN